MIIKPTKDRLLLRRDLRAEVQQTEGGLYIPAIGDERVPYLDKGGRSQVMAAGPEVKEVKVGDWVYLDKLCGIRVVEKPDHELWIAWERQVIALEQPDYFDCFRSDCADRVDGGAGSTRCSRYDCNMARYFQG